MCGSSEKKSEDLSNFDHEDSPCIEDDLADEDVQEHSQIKMEGMHIDCIEKGDWVRVAYEDFPPYKVKRIVGDEIWDDTGFWRRGSVIKWVPEHDEKVVVKFVDDRIVKGIWCLASNKYEVILDKGLIHISRSLVKSVEPDVEERVRPI